MDIGQGDNLYYEGLLDLNSEVAFKRNYKEKSNKDVESCDYDSSGNGCLFDDNYDQDESEISIRTEFFDPMSINLVIKDIED